MKKKIALLLALIMTISLMPVTIFAKSNNRISKTITTVRNESVFYGTNWNFKSAVNSSDGKPFTGLSGKEKDTSWNRTYDKDISKRKSISARFEASYLVMQLEDRLSPNSAFRLTLTNATWLFAVTANTVVNTVDPSKNIASSSAVVALLDPEVYTVSWSDDFLSYTYDLEAAETAGKTNIYGDIGYTMKVSTGNPSVATVTFADGDTGSGTLRIPMTMYVANNNVDVSVTVGDNNSAFSSGSYAIVSTASGSTENSFASIRTGRETITLDTLVMKETRVGALTGGGMEIFAPAGYRFVNNPHDWDFVIEPGLGLVYADDGKSKDIDYNIYYRDFYEGESYVLVFATDNTGTGDGLGNSALSPNSIPGSIEISNIKIEPIDYKEVVIGQDLFVTLAKYLVGSGALNYRDQKTGDTISTLTNKDELSIKAEQVLAAKSVDWTVTLTSEGTTNLVAGRLDTTNGAYASNNGSHRSAFFVFEEQEVGAWNAARTTTFKLPEGVKILGIDIDYATNVYTKYDSQNGYTLPLKDVYNAGNIRTELGKPSSITSFTDQETGCITFRDNEFSFKNLLVNSDTTTNDGKAKIRMRLELSIAPDYPDDTTIEISVDGTAIPEDISKVAIAKVRQPITVTAKTTQVEIGYQSFEVSDVTITENVAGAIRRLVDQNGTLKLALTDYYTTSSSDDLMFAPIKKEQVKVTSGDLKVTLRDVTNGVINIDVDRASSTPSTLVVSGLAVRVNRNVPYGSYDLLVYGNSVFGNYWKNSSGTIVRGSLSSFGYANENGYVAKDYIKVATVGAGASPTSINSQILIYPGSSTIHVDGKTVQLQEAPFIDNATGTTYVPVRFVSEALGMLVAWNDATRTATITTDGYTVMLSLDNSTMLVNGIPNSMTNQLGVSVAPFEKNGRMYIPIRAFFEAFGCNVGWDQATNTATIN